LKIAKQGGSFVLQANARVANDRTATVEARYAMQAQDTFYKQVRAARAAGQWAAQTMGLVADDAKDYAASVVDALVVHNTADPVFEKISADLDARGVTCTPHWVRQQLACLPQG